MRLVLSPKVFRHRVRFRGFKPRLRFSDGRFAPFGAKRNPLAKGKTKRSYNAKKNKAGTGIDQIRTQVRNSTGNKSRPLAYGFILNRATASFKAKPGKNAAKGDVRRSLQTVRQYKAKVAKQQAEADARVAAAKVSASSAQPKYKVEFNANFGGGASEPVNGRFGQVVRAYDKLVAGGLALSAFVTTGQYARYKLNQSERHKAQRKKKNKKDK